ncbi:MAG: DUF3768 domain-containing protein [Rhodobacteraceae bacterium]|nr:DUF3768 domain-containing protein [Paracoccaceae bacterium]
MIFTTGLLNYAIEKGRNPAELVALVRDFDAFSDDNDPHKEHDFGNFNFEGLKVYWKFDYYDPDLIYGSNDPSDPAQTFRVLTVFLASEY